MSSTNSLDACNPLYNATVSASAGSGKTWLLITRIVRLLIDGAEPGNIIALTFTRKAAGEMQIRLNQRLFELATADDETLVELLQLIGCNTDQKTKAIAVSLYEKLIHSLYPVRIQTFHSFCQDILTRFPLEADIPPGFDLLEDTSILERQAWQALFSEANIVSQEHTESSLREKLDTLMQVCNGPGTTRNAIVSFLKQRSDWWAYTNHTSKPVTFASEQLASLLELNQEIIDGDSNPVDIFLNGSQIENLMIFANLLREIKNKTSEKHANNIDIGLKEKNKNRQYSLIKSAFLKKDGEVLVQGRKHTASMEKKLGAELSAKFIDLHHEIAEAIQQTEETIKRLLSYKINTAWYFSGHRFVEIFQRLKRELRLLDFTDLEWKCYQLLQHADNAHWVQYKIDQRIDHILIDEFQDTNPTQWHLLSPILEEIAASPEERNRSVFLVGDEKQSIYSFRRANPALQKQASQWLAENLKAKATPLDFSRRSSAAVINSVNMIFQQDDVHALMPGFTTHDTYLKNLPGKVTLCDLFEEDIEDNDEETNVIHFRNPLKQAREISTKTVHHKEAEYIARQILALKDNHNQITENGIVRPVEFGDIMILMRTRNHTSIYEQALKQNGIPFIGNKKGGFLENLEIQDLICLLNTLITPYNNLAFAQVLKSPIFNVSDDDLILLAREKSATHWSERLTKIANIATNNSAKTISPELLRASVLLPRWQQLAEQLPVHDCLDKIFLQGNIINRYIAANKQKNKMKVAANCQRFLELSLETDSGRYPGITRFLQHLEHLKNYSDNPPEDALSQSTESRVQLMTIHASKGLESPIVFLADCNNTSVNRNAYESLVRWPASKPHPTHFQLQLSKENTDKITHQLQQEKMSEQKREELNLLYVALTRAREQLYITGNASSKKQENSWYQTISSGLVNAPSETTIDNLNCKIIKHLDYKSPKINKTDKEVTQQATIKIDERLLKPLPDEFLRNSSSTDYLISPSLVTTKNASSHHGKTKLTESENDQDLAKRRGIIIHRFIELLCSKQHYPAINDDCNEILRRLKNETALNKPDYLQHLDGCLQEAVETYNNPLFKDIFHPEKNSTSFNEMPIMYKQKKNGVYGFIDRVIKTDTTVTIIDYKSHQLKPTQTTSEVAQEFYTQLNYYSEGIRKIWPNHNIKAGILLTEQQKIVWLS